MFYNRVEVFPNVRDMRCKIFYLHCALTHQYHYQQNIYTGCMLSAYGTGPLGVACK